MTNSHIVLSEDDMHRVLTEALCGYGTALSHLTVDHVDKSEDGTFGIILTPAPEQEDF